MRFVGFETINHVRINYTIAGVGERIFATLLDGIVLFSYYIIFAAFAGMVNLPSWLVVAGYILPSFLYFLILEVVWNGYTLGKRIVGIRVAKLDGTRASLSGYLFRWMFGLLEIFATGGLLPIVVILANGKGQRLGDIAGGTCVIKVQKRIELNETFFRDVAANHRVVLPRVEWLADKDISIVNEVLSAKKKYSHEVWVQMAAKTRALIEKKIGKPESKLTNEQFLKTVLDDYNAVYLSKESEV